MTKRVPLFSVFLLVVLAAAQTTPLMPTIDGESLTGSKVSLPEAAKGKVAVLVLGFTKASKTATSAWADRLFADFAAQNGFALYQLPILESVPGFVRGMVISSMKKGVRSNMRDHFVPIVHGEAELKKLVGYKEPDDAYLVVLDSGGNVIEQRCGPFNGATYAQLRVDIQSQLSHQK